VIWTFAGAAGKDRPFRSGGKLVSVGVVEGEEGWLFLTGGSNVLGALYDRNSALLPDAKILQWAELIEARARRLQAISIQYVHINIPEKLTIYDNKLPHPPIVDWALSPAVRLGEMVQRQSHGHVWLDLVGPFRAARDRQELFYKTDSHWNGEGCFLAYTLLCEKLGVNIVPSLLTRRSSQVRAVLDLGSKFTPPVYEDIKIYQYADNATRTYSNTIAKYLQTVQSAAKIHVGSHVRYNNDDPGAAKKKILIFGDSYSDIETGALTGMLAETVQQVEFVWSSNIDWNYIERTKPDVVVYELVERFMTILPNDQLSLPRRFDRQSLKARRLLIREKRRALNGKIRSILTDRGSLRSLLGWRRHED
jgi:hypothetical protein